MLSVIRPAIASTLLFTLIFGVAYPLAVTGVAGVIFPHAAAGSLVRDRQGRVVGSFLIGQSFTAAAYLHGRPSAAGKGYDGAASSGSNLGPLNPDLIRRESQDAAGLRRTDGATGIIPADAVTTSASGLDPDVSPDNARRQASRIARARGVPVSQVRRIIETHVDGPLLGFLGQPRVNVLMTNLDLDARFGKAHA